MIVMMNIGGPFFLMSDSISFFQLLKLVSGIHRNPGSYTFIPKDCAAFFIVATMSSICSSSRFPLETYAITQFLKIRG